jgi:microcystin-dependent protein
VTVLPAQMPAHTHTVVATSAAATTGTPGSTVVPGAVSNQTMYVTDLTGATPFSLLPQSVSQGGGSQPHENCMPTLTVQFCIATQGIFPSQA